MALRDVLIHSVALILLDKNTPFSVALLVITVSCLSYSSPLGRYQDVIDNNCVCMFFDEGVSHGENSGG